MLEAWWRWRHRLASRVWGLHRHTRPHASKMPAQGGPLLLPSWHFLTIFVQASLFLFFPAPCSLCSVSVGAGPLLWALMGGAGSSWLPLTHCPHSAYPRPCLIHRTNYGHTSQTSLSTWATQGNSSTQVSGPGSAPIHNFHGPQHPDPRRAMPWGQQEGGWAHFGSRLT